MIKSMTGFGSGSAEGPSFRIRVDMRSVNNRFLDIHARLPQELASLEISFKKQVQTALKRGRVDITVFVEQLKPVRFEINRPLVSGYLAALSELKSEFGLEGNPSLELVAKLNGALHASQSEGAIDKEIVEGATRALAAALDVLTRMRVAEGEGLLSEMEGRLSTIESEMPAIEREAEKLPSLHREKITKRIADAMAGGHIDESRLAQEAALLAERSDISEEIARLKSHLVQTRDLLRSDEEVGKRLDFMLQEMNREANTILSKSNDLSICDAAIVIKAEVERLREQAQNVE